MFLYLSFSRAEDTKKAATVTCGAHAEEEWLSRVGCGLSWRLLSAARWQRRLRTTKKRRRRCRREETSKSHQRSCRGREEAKRRVGICVVGTLDLVGVFLLCVATFTLFSDRKREGIQPSRTIRLRPPQPPPSSDRTHPRRAKIVAKAGYVFSETTLFTYREGVRSRWVRLRLPE